jgi:catalase
MRSTSLFTFVNAAVLVSAMCPIMNGGQSLRKRANGLPGDDGFLDQFKVDDSDSFTTTDSGTRVDDTHSLKAGQRGSTLLEDFVLRTKITRFDHERIPERAGTLWISSCFVAFY